jgi:LuxR family maltose regulon positive regulatory protein
MKRQVAATTPGPVSPAKVQEPPGALRALTEPLSQRELEVLALICKGLSNQEIGRKLFVSLSTVKWHNQNIFDKLDVQRRTEAVARAQDLNLL